VFPDITNQLTYEHQHFSLTSGGICPGRSIAAWWQALPLTTVFVLFFMIPLALVLMVSFWDYNRVRTAAGFHLQELHLGVRRLLVAQ